MHADDTIYAVIKNGVVVVSGTGPAIRVDDNRLVIRDGPQETPPLFMTRAEASRRLRHVIACGSAGGFITFEALRWLRDTSVAFSQLDWDGSIIITSGPRGPDRPALRRAQALVCSGITPKSTVAIMREILRVKLNGQAAIARLMGAANAGSMIDELTERIAGETDGTKVLSAEASAASIYWKLWKTVPVRFAHRNPQRLGPNGRWRAGRSDLWPTFGARASVLTGKPHRATTPGNSLLNYLYALLESEMTVALLAAGLDPGIGMFHADLDGRSSLALDAIEAVRPHVDYWLLSYLALSAFANRDFTELPDGEVRLSHPLNSHLGQTAAIWQQACEPVARWLTRSFSQAVSGGAVLMDDKKTKMQQWTLPGELERGRDIDLLKLLPPFTGPGRGRWPTPLPAGLRHDPVPLMCWECGKGLVDKKRRFCSNVCAKAFPVDRLNDAVERRRVPVPAQDG